MSCQRVLSMLSAYIDGEVPGRDADMIEKHLGQCALCAREMDALRRTTGILQAAPEVEPPAFLLEQIEAATVRQPRFWEQVRSRLTHTPAYARWATAAAAAAIVFAVIAVPNRDHQYQARSTDTRQVEVREPAPAQPSAPAAKAESMTAEVSEVAPTVAVQKHRPVAKRSVHRTKRTVMAKARRTSDKPVRAVHVAAIGEPIEQPAEAGIPDKDVASAEGAKTTESTTVQVAYAAEDAGGASAGKGAPAKINQRPTLVAAEPSAIEQIRTALATRNRRRSLDTYVERIEGRKYSVELMGLRF